MNAPHDFDDESPYTILSTGKASERLTSPEDVGLADFVPLLLEPPQPGVPEPERLYQAVRRAARPGLFDDDFSLLAVTFE